MEKLDMTPKGKVKGKGDLMFYELFLRDVESPPKGPSFARAPSKGLIVKKRRKPVSKIRKLICALLLPVEIMCEIMVNKPRLALSIIFGVILFIGKFISAKAAMLMVFSMILIFFLTKGKEISHTEEEEWRRLQYFNNMAFENKDDPVGFFARRLTIPADPFRNF